MKHVKTVRSKIDNKVEITLEDLVDLLGDKLGPSFIDDGPVKIKHMADATLDTGRSGDMGEVVLVLEWTETVES